jgi:hypothetical protein
LFRIENHAKRRDSESLILICLAQLVSAREDKASPGRREIPGVGTETECEAGRGGAFTGKAKS